MKKLSYLKTWLLAALLLLGSGSSWGADLINENIQSWTARASYGTYTQSITAGTVNMTACIVQPSASASGTGSIGRVQMQGANGILELPTLSSVGTIEFRIAAGGASRTVKLQKKDGISWVDVTTFTGIGTAGVTLSHEFNSASSTQLRLSTPSSAIYVHDIIITDYVTSSPLISLSVTSLTGFGYVESNGPSSEQSFTVSGANLTSDISIAAPTNYEISKTSGSGYATPLTFAHSGGTVSEQTVYVRLKAGLAIGNYNSEVITASTTGATDATVTVSGAVLKPEPTNHVTGFTATTNSHSSITVTWTDAIGSQVPDGYLVKAAVDPATPGAPNDGTTESSATLVKNINHGVQTVEFTGLNQSTTYNFSIWPYTNSGTDIDYKTDGTVPTANAETETVIIPKVFISEYIEGSSNNKAIEIYNGESSEIDLTKLVVELYSNGGTTASNTYTGSGMLSPGGTIIIYNSGATAGIVNLGTASSTITFFNGDDALKVTYDGVVADVFGQIGTDPGTGWSVAGTSNATVDKTLIRKLSVTSGNTVNLGSFGTNADDSEWFVMPLDYLGNLGAFGTAFNGSVDSSWETSGNWDIGLPTSSQKAIIPSVTNSPIIDTNVELSSLLLKPAAKLTINGGKTLSIFGDLLLQSNSTNGTATLVNNGTLTVTGTSTVQQHLTGATGSGRAWWYIGVPVTGAKTDIFGLQATEGTNKMGYYQESKVGGPGYEQILNTTTDLVPGVGYALNTGGNDAVYNFSGTLKTGEVTLAPTRTGTTHAKRGFNLIANPYPSYLDWELAHDGATNIRPTIWYRTYTTGAMVFNTYNDGVAVPASSVTGKIPPLQAFWVRVHADGSDGSLVLTNAMREHAGASSNLLRAPAASVKQLVRLMVSNGVNTDETVLVTNTKASDNYDYYDSEKMSNSNVNIPEIFTLAGSEELVINTLNSIEHGKELILGFRPGKTGEFTIGMTEIANMDYEVVLKDKVAVSEKVLTLGESYSFGSDETATNDRFSILFRSPGSTTGLNSSTSSLNVYANADNRITIQTATVTAQSVANVHNLAGQRVASQQLKGVETVIDAQLASGIYLVTVSDGMNKTTQRVVVK